MERDMEKEYDAYSNAISIISGANMASPEELKLEINLINKIIGTGYYDDEDGDFLLKQIVLYLTNKLK